MKFELEAISVEDRLPEIDVWVLVLEDDTENPQDFFIAQLLKHAPRHRFTPARLRRLDHEGYPEWYMGYVGGSPVNHVRNVTHWMEIPKLPFKEIEINVR